jgi:hypothetical protein
MDAFIDIENLNTDNSNFSKKDTFTIFPNPTSNFLKIKLSGNIRYSLKIFNILGEELIESSNYRNMQTIDISNLNNGIYILKINSSEYKFFKL